MTSWNISGYLWRRLTMRDDQLQALESLGVNYNDVLGRFMGKESFFIRMLNKFPADTSFEDAKQALAEGDYEKVFHGIHTLKGLTSNFGFEVLMKDIYEVNEELRTPPYNEEYIKEKFVIIEENYRNAMDVINTYFAE